MQPNISFWLPHLPLLAYCGRLCYTAALSSIPLWTRILSHSRQLHEIKMRLINCSTNTLEEFIDEETPPYAILSHTWEAHEISYKEYNDDQSLKTYPRAAAKIAATIEVALEATERQVNYIWIGMLCKNVVRR